MRVTRYMLHVQSFSQAGFSTLPVVLFLGGLMMEIAIAVAFLLNLFTTTNYAARLSSEALLIAESGIEDAMMRVVRNKDCPATGCPSSYDLALSGKTAALTIRKDYPAVGKTQIDSVGASRSQRRKLTAILAVNATTGEVDIDSIQEVAF